MAVNGPLPLTPRRWRWSHVVLIGVIASALQIVAASRSTTEFTWDSPGYIVPANAIACCGTFDGVDLIAYRGDAGSFPIVIARAETVRTPVYPLILSLSLRFGSIRSAVIAQRVVMVCFAIAFYLFVATEFGGAIGLIAALFIACWPPALDAAGVIMTEAYFAVILALGLAVFLIGWRSQRPVLLALAGLLLGIATLTRPVALYLPIPLVAILLVRRVSMRAIVVFALAAAILPIAWAARNHARAGAFLVSSIEGENLLMYRAAGVLTVSHMTPLHAATALQRQTGYYREAHRIRPALHLQAVSTAARDGIRPDDLTHAILSQYYGRLGMRIILAHPVAYAELATTSFIELYFAPLAMSAARAGMNLSDANITFIPMAIAIFCLAVFGVWRMFKIDRSAAILIATVLAYFTIVSCGPEVEERFLVPYLAVYAVAVAVGIVQLRTLLTR
jgi:4-amino-4-deoxy-L-arabinose transferase-like glycosyltransferase